MDPLTTTASLGFKALGLLKRFWYVLPILAMAAYCLVLRGDLAEERATSAGLRTDKVQLEGRNATTQASLDGALSRIGVLNRDALDRAARYQTDLADAKATAAALAERYRATASTVARLEASARDNTQDPCRVTDAAQEALKGL